MFPDLGKTFLTQRRDGTLEPRRSSAARAAEALDGGSAAVATEFVIDVHGEQLNVSVTGTARRAQRKRNFYLTLDGVPEEVVVEALGE